MGKAARRQHFIARFYLRNFAEPLFSDNLCVVDMRKQRWERRTPTGVGWFPHLCSMIDMDGSRSDGFDQFLKQKVEDPAAPALRKLATAEALSGEDRSAIALFIPLTAARSPELMSSVISTHIDNLEVEDRYEFAELVKIWCDTVGKDYGAESHHEFLKPSYFGATWEWSRRLHAILLRLEWTVIKTTKDETFVTSDRPVFAQQDPNSERQLVTFPVSTEVSLVMASEPLDSARDRSREVWTTNRQTMDRASEFVVASKSSFPGDEFLAALGARH